MSDEKGAQRPFFYLVFSRGSSPTDSIEFSHRIEHRDDVLRRNVREDVMYRIENKAAAGAEYRQAFENMHSY